MKIAIIGVGGVGGYFGGKLATHYANNKDVDVTFIARGKHLEEIQNNGLKVITAEYREDIKEIVWEKYVFVSPLASATSFYQKTFGEIMENAECKNLLQGLLKETERIAKFQNVNLPNDIFQKSLDKIALFPYETKSSLQMDFEKKKNTELDIFAGYIVEYAKEHGIDVPFHEKVYEVLSRRIS